MKRRSFLKNTGKLASGFFLTSPLMNSAIAYDCRVTRLPGAQLYTLRDMLGKDVESTLSALSQTGIREVELYGINGGETEILGLPLNSFKALLEKYNLSLSLTHISGDNINISEVSKTAHALGISTVILAIAPGFIQFNNGSVQMAPPQGEAELIQLAKLLNDLGTGFNEAGLTFAYHNHHVEFIPTEEGYIPFDYLMSETDPELVKLELDLGWLALAGVDPVSQLMRYRNRTISCHLKDYTGGPDFDIKDLSISTARLVEPGAGTIDFEAVLETMDALGIQHGFIEIDASADPLAAIENGNRYLQALRPC